MRTASSRTSLAQSIVTLFQQWPVFKGVSIDWEYLSNNGVNYGASGNNVDPSDSANFASFVSQLRSMFNQQGWNNYTIALCCASAPEKVQFDVASLIPLLDEWHVMTYEYPPPSLSNSIVTKSIALRMGPGQILLAISLTLCLLLMDHILPPLQCKLTSPKGFHPRKSLWASRSTPEDSQEPMD